jgi:hypothetical protein
LYSKETPAADAPYGDTLASSATGFSVSAMLIAAFAMLL